MRVTLTILLVIVARALSENEPCNIDLSVELNNHEHNGVTYKDGEYFVDNQTGIERGCVCMKETCARKCCPFSQAYNMTFRGCVNYSVPFDPPVWNNYRKIEGFNASEEFHFVIGKMTCNKLLKEVRVPVYSAVHSYDLQMDGSLYVKMAEGTPDVIYGPDKYCIDTFLDDRENKAEVKLNALICFAEIPEGNHYTLSSTCMLVSCVFFLLTVAVYAWLPELRNLHGMVLIAYLLSFFVGFLCMASLQISILNKTNYAKFCLSATFIAYFSLLAAFFWMNVMCFDIWYTFSGKRGQSGMRSVRARFLMYCAYAFGVPALLTVLLVALEFSDLPDHSLLPHLRRGGCFLYKQSKLLYLYGPITVLCVMNLLFFILTAVKIAKIKSQTKILKSNESSTHDPRKQDKQLFLLYIKLFAVMGFNWILEVVSALYPEADGFWQYTDAYNVLVGLIIFIIFVCKKKTLRMLRNRYKVMRGLSISRVQTTTSTSIRTLNSQSRDSIHMNSINKGSNNKAVCQQSSVSES